MYVFNALSFMLSLTDLQRLDGMLGDWLARKMRAQASR
jgi:hypothetical protein